MELILFYLFFLPAPLREFIWIAASCGAAYLAWSATTNRRLQVVGALAAFVIVYSSPATLRFLRSAVVDYQQAKDAWLRGECRELAQSPAGATPLAVEGYLDQTDYDRLLTERFHRAAREIEARDGRQAGQLVIDTGRYKPHLAVQAMRADTFAGHAARILIEEKLSFVEFEMRPENGEYTNSSSMQTKSWTGIKYRRYYLAPIGHPACFWDDTVKYTTGGASIGGVVHPFCVALEVSDSSLARYRIVGDEEKKTHRWTGYIRGLSIPFLTTIRWDYISLLDGMGSELKMLDQKRAFSYPSETSRQYDCAPIRSPKLFVTEWFSSKSSKAFFRDRKWYAGSTVQRFYEGDVSDQVVSSGSGAAELSRFQGEARSPFIRQIPMGTSNAVISSSPSLSPDAVKQAIDGARMGTLDPESEAKLRELFREAIALSLAGDHSLALGKYHEALKLDPVRDATKQNIATLERIVQRADSEARTHDQAIRRGDKSPKALADRGRAYFRAGDAGRGARDLARALELADADAQIAVDLALMYLGTNQPERVAAIASDTARRFPAVSNKAYEIRAWASFLTKDGKAAFADAVAALGHSSNWTPETFGSERAGYRVLAGYFGLQQIGQSERAKTFLQEWQTLAKPEEWPDAMILHILGRLSEGDIKAVAGGKSSWDVRGSAPAECAAFLALHDIFQGRVEQGRKRFFGQFSSNYGAGYSLALTIASRTLKRQIY